MQAAVVHDFTKSLSIQETPKPVPGPGEVLVKVETAGLCHTDIHAAQGDWPIKPTLPLIPGHEGVGIVEQVGPGVTTPRVGDRVAMPWLGAACGTCEYCVDGWETLCESQVNTGYGVNGSYAEYATATLRTSLKFPTPWTRSTPPCSPAPESRRTRRSSSPGLAPGRLSRYSASEGSAISRSSTPRSAVPPSSPSTSTTRSSSWPRNLAPIMWSTR